MRANIARGAALGGRACARAQALECLSFWPGAEVSALAFLVPAALTSSAVLVCVCVSASMSVIVCVCVC